jgi:hypothetical protein
MENKQAFLTEKELSVYASIPLSTLRNWRFRGEGPPFKKPSSRMVRYSLNEFQEWMEKFTVLPFE